MSAISVAPSPSAGPLSVAYLQTVREQIEQRLSTLMAEASAAPEHLNQSIRHSLLAPGKRLRALLTIIVAEEFSGNREAAIDFGCALEMVHAASLILDDLPAMDDAKLRRGLPANHIVYGESTAILAAIALLNQAFAVVAKAPGLSPSQNLTAVEALQKAIGTAGLAAGQEEDLHSLSPETTLEQLEGMYGRKTGTLFAAAAELGLIAATPVANATLQPQLHHLGLTLGIGFQVLDDVLDVADTEAHAGKDVHQDAGRPTAVTLLGLNGARRHAENYILNMQILSARLFAEGPHHGQLFAGFINHLQAAFAHLRMASPKP